MDLEVDTEILACCCKGCRVLGGFRFFAGVTIVESTGKFPDGTLSFLNFLSSALTK